MLNAQESNLEGGAREANTGMAATMDHQIARFHIVCLECGSTGSLVSSKDAGTQEIVGFKDHTMKDHEGRRPLKCNICGQSNYELVRDVA